MMRIKLAISNTKRHKLKSRY